MLKSLKELKGFAIEAKDAVLGSVHDFYFDDDSWTVRYLVVDTGFWLPGRLVLISPAAFLVPDWRQGVFPVRLTKKQVMNSPAIDAAMPISRQQEYKLSRYYDWPAYWMGAPWFMVGVPPLLNRPAIEAAERKRADEIVKRSDPHLRSFREISGYRVEASDGAVGRIVDLVVDAKDWVIRGVAVDSRPWFPGGHVLLPPSRIESMLWRDKRIVVEMSLDEIKMSPAYHAPYALEESATGKPSRKSTRKSANRSKPSHPQRRSKRLERLRGTRLARSRRRSPLRRAA